MAKNFGVLGIGKPKPGEPDAGGPPEDPDDAMPGMPAAAAAKPAKQPTPISGPGPSSSPLDDEATETPDFEASEESGGSLMSGIESAGSKFGLDSSQSQQVAAEFFSAIAKALGGSNKSDLASALGGGDDGSGDMAPTGGIGA